MLHLTKTEEKDDWFYSHWEEWEEMEKLEIGSIRSQVVKLQHVKT